MRILIVEDNQDIAESMGDFLELHDCTVDYALDGLSATALISQNEYDVLLFDIGLPGMDGLSLCEKVRQTDTETPILFLTARDTLQDKITGFESGADDYLVKPFQLPELLVRIKAIYRRSQPNKQNLIQIEDMSLDTQTHQVKRAGQDITLTPIGFQILLELAQASPNMVSREKLESILWQDQAPDSDALRSHMYSLRQKLDKPFATPLIQTLPRKGFRLCGA